MNNEEKELLLKDLCARLPYGVKVMYKGWDSDHGCEFTTVEEVIGIDDKFIHTLWRDERDKHSIVEPKSIIDYKPYLRPMSSMTEEEIKHYGNLLVAREPYSVGGCQDYLNSIHIDYRGLILMGLALEAPKGMYKEDEE